MKRTLIALIMVFYSFVASAQKSALYGDVGLSFARFKPGASATFNYKIFPLLGMGLGFQAYDFHATKSNYQYVPAVYGELRLNICPRKANQFFAFLDIGADFYKHNDDIWEQDNYLYKVHSDNGTYAGLGLGYLRRMPKLRLAPYASLKMISNNYKADSYDLITSEQGTKPWGDATLVLSVGCKF